MENETVKQILRDFSKQPISYDVYLLANSQDKTPSCGWDGIVHASPDEFFSRSEFAEIASAIFDVFGYVRVFYSELEFIQFVLNYHVKRDECLVYNLARDGCAEGKKSLIPAFCDLTGLRYTGSNAFVISLLRNKFVYSCLLLQHDIPVPQTFLYDVRGKCFPYGTPENGQKVILKNVRESASIGLTERNVFIFQADRSTEELIRCCCTNMRCDIALLQDFIPGAECEVLVLETPKGYVSLDPVEIRIKGSEILSTQISNAYQYSFCSLSDHFPKQTCQDIQMFAKHAAQLLGIRTCARFDFRIDNQNRCWLIDIAGTPYTIRHSSISYLFRTMYQLKYEDIYKVIAFLALQKQSEVDLVH